MEGKIRVRYKVAFDNGKKIYTSDTPGIAVSEFSVARRSSDDEARMSFRDYSEGEFDFNYRRDNIVDDLVRELFNHMGFYYESAFEYGPLPLWIMQDRMLYGIQDLSLVFSSVLDMIQNDKTELLIYLIYSHQAGYVIGAADGVKYRMYSKESGKHNVPHVHVEFGGDKKASISIKDGKVLAGVVPKKVLKVVRKRIADNRYELLSAWKRVTDGIEIDLEYFLKEKEITFIKGNT